MQESTGLKPDRFDEKVYFLYNTGTSREMSIFPEFFKKIGVDLFSRLSTEGPSAFNNRMLILL